ncbi:hypothetical protein HWD97_03765 [Ochrobactrum sp. C6C9]|uniref:hypothetical protein n=1 Tax=Ochrobactrum sp. C6C9 TaxID=2736662 RepID=UPI0035301F70|nr:hypothetical protein [Ochrobactrum sp. C6C9]
MKFRLERASLEASLATVREISGQTEMLEAIEEDHQIPPAVYFDIVPLGFDPHTNWNTYVVIVGGFGVVGYLDGPLK